MVDFNQSMLGSNKLNKKILNKFFLHNFIYTQWHVYYKTSYLLHGLSLKMALPCGLPLPIVMLNSG